MKKQSQDQTNEQLHIDDAAAAQEEYSLEDIMNEFGGWSKKPEPEKQAQTPPDPQKPPEKTPESRKPDTLLKTGNVTVDAILSAKLAQARAAGIAVTAEANLPPELSLTDLELSIVIGNLLDNAIEGCRSAAGEKFLRLSLRMKGDMLYFYLLNSAVWRKN